jgi:hypothetical protein
MDEQTVRKTFKYKLTVRPVCLQPGQDVSRGKDSRSRAPDNCLSEAERNSRPSG